MDWMKTTRNTWNSSKARPKHARQDYPQSPEASFQKCLLLEVINVLLQSSKSFCRIVLLKHVQLVRFICLVCQIHPRKFVTSNCQRNDEGHNQRNNPGRLPQPWKTFSNHSARKTVVKKLKTAGLEQSLIVKVTGHQNEKSLDDFDKGDENEHRQLFHTISHGTTSIASYLDQTAPLRSIVATTAPAIFSSRLCSTLNAATTSTK